MLKPGAGKRKHRRNIKRGRELRKKRRILLAKYALGEIEYSEFLNTYKKMRGGKK